MGVVQSFAKNFGLYNARVGCLSFLFENKENVDRMNDYMGFLVRS